MWLSVGGRGVRGGVVSGELHVPLRMAFVVVGVGGEGAYVDVGEGGVGGADGGSMRWCGRQSWCRIGFIWEA